jgi:ribonuclease HII
MARRTPPNFALEAAAIARGLFPVAGVDEAGRGPLAGPVVAAAVILRTQALPAGLADSKTLSPARRAALDAAVRASGAVGVGLASVDEIDRLNILRASLLAMERAVAALPEAPAFVLVDGNRLPAALPCAAEAVVKGDARSLSVAAASIVAKVARDTVMVTLAQQFPGYGWERNAGYPTPDHLEALRRLGPTPHHRRSFGPVHKML